MGVPILTPSVELLLEIDEELEGAQVVFFVSSTSRVERFELAQ